MRHAFLALLFALLAFSARAQTDSVSRLPHPEKERAADLAVRVGNESNPADGVFGPFTYGLLGGYAFEIGIALNATFVRLHEPGTRVFDSFLDEGELAV